MSKSEVKKDLGRVLRVDHCHRRDRVPPKTKMGRVIVYSKISFVRWLEAREVKTQDYHHKFLRNKR
jgi:hypothetical protein